MFMLIQSSIPISLIATVVLLYACRNSPEYRCTTSFRKDLMGMSYRKRFFLALLWFPCHNYAYSILDSDQERTTFSFVGCNLSTLSPASWWHCVGEFINYYLQSAFLSAFRFVSQVYRLFLIVHVSFVEFLNNGGRNLFTFKDLPNF